LEKPSFSGFCALGNALLLGLFPLSDGLLDAKSARIKTSSDLLAKKRPSRHLNLEGLSFIFLLA
jgi:hypothetical protein